MNQKCRNFLCALVLPMIAQVCRAELADEIKKVLSDNLLTHARSEYSIRAAW